jgi:hypothetical protein
MAQLINKNEKITVPLFKNGVTLQFFNVSFPITVAAKLTTDYANFANNTYTAEQAKSPVAKVLEAIQARVSIEVIGAVQDNGAGAGRDMRIGVAAIGGNYPTDQYNGTGGNEAMYTYLQEIVRAAGTASGVSYQGVDITQVTITDFVI